MQPLQFGILAANADQLFWGACRTIEFSAISMAFGLVISVLGAYGKTEGPRWAGRVITVYVEIIRNTPFIVQIFLVYFGLPSAGLRLGSDTAAILAMALNAGAYGTEIVRAGLESVSRGQREAGRSLGLTPQQVFRLIILPPALRSIYPALTSQFILLLLASSVVSTISAEELTAAATDIQNRTFISMEVYLVILVIYFLISSGFSILFAIIGRLLFKAQQA